MKRIVISSLAVIAILAAAMTVLGSSDRSIASKSMNLSEEVQAKVDVAKLANLEFEDQSLVYSTPAKR